MEYISKKVAAYGQFVLVILEFHLNKCFGLLFEFAEKIRPNRIIKHFFRLVLVFIKRRSFPLVLLCLEWGGGRDYPLHLSLYPPHNHNWCKTLCCVSLVIKR